MPDDDEAVGAVVAPSPTVPTLDRSVAFWLRAYPRRWRAVRAAEVAAVLIDIAGPGARRLDAAAAVGLLRGGWATRRREHPTLGVYLSYRLRERPIQASCREWARDDIEGSWFPVRRGIGASWFFWLFGVIHLLAGSPSWFWFLGPLGMVAAACMLPHRMRSSQARRHLALRAGERVVPGALIEGLGPRRRLDARGTLSASAVVLAGAAGVGIAAVWVRPPMLVATGVAAVVGLALVPLVRHRLRRLITACPPQPHRDLVARRPRAWAGIVAAAVVVVATLGVLAGGLWFTGTRRLLLELSGLLGPLALLALPGVVAAAVIVRRGGAAASGLSVSDVRTIVLLGRAPMVDETRLGLVRVDGAGAAGALPAGQAVTITYLVEERPPRRRLEARGALTAALVVVAAAAAAWTPAALIGPTALHLVSCATSTEPGAARCSQLVATPMGDARGVVVLALVVTAALGLACVPLVRSRLVRLAPVAPEQPHRVLVDLPAWVRVAAVVAAAVVVVEAVLEATGRFGVVAAAVLGPLALIVLPGLVVASQLVRDLPDARGLAGSDVLAMALLGRVPDVDRLSRSVTLATGAVPVGTVLPALPLELPSRAAEIETTVPSPFRPRGLPS
jgi:hypothetical protein